MNRIECDLRTTTVHTIVRSIIGRSKCNTKVDSVGKRLTYKGIDLTDTQLNQLKNSLSNYYCDIKAYNSLYNKRILTVHVLFRVNDKTIEYTN